MYEAARSGRGCGWIARWRPGVHTSIDSRVPDVSGAFEEDMRFRFRWPVAVLAFAVLAFAGPNAEARFGKAGGGGGGRSGGARPTGPSGGGGGRGVYPPGYPGVPLYPGYYRAPWYYGNYYYY